MIDPISPPSTRARAADSVLEHSAKAIELEDIEARVSELERPRETAKRHSQKLPVRRRSASLQGSISGYGQD
jgi:hypothetical protein